MKKIRPTEKELEILQVLWEKEGSTVREVHEILYPNEETGYTTTLKLMQIMFDKGLISRTKAGKTHHYTAIVDKENIQSELLNRFVSNVFSGSTSSLILQLLGNTKNTPEEIKEIRDYLDKIDKK
ncbi:MAG: BlaI/MecI/CopY family transcriptional regulator [Cyclobacteriaceae bacterium]|nr:BlaI/MecI/CopY family transcriptional regulator [Cyclobacteriaceae bacterium]